jgi:hypothetical protein
MHAARARQNESHREREGEHENHNKEYEARNHCHKADCHAAIVGGEEREAERKELRHHSQRHE